VPHPRDVLRRGEEVEVYVLGVDRERQRIALSLKHLQPDPWSLVDERYEVGQLIEGTITNVVSFGAFARVEDGLEGLIHISELAEGDFLHPRNVVKEGDKVTVRILDINSARHRLRLSLRQAWTANGDVSDSDQLWDAF
jgi:small subunit ribosomal protein S1